MFRTTPPSQGDLLTSHELGLDASRRKKLLEPGAWHNVFYEQLVCAIDEEAFKPLFDDSRGRPNASVRTLLGMLVLKDGRRWSDAELFEECAFNLQVMRALGLTNFSEKVPVPATYYDFKRRLFEYQVDHGVNLLDQAFESVTRKQAQAFGVKADWIRMDSTLIGSNIANCCRLQLVLGCLRVFWKSLSPGQRKKASQADRSFLNGLLKCEPHQVVYQLKEDEKPQKLEELGYVISRLLKIYTPTDSDRFGPLSRLFSEHYRTKRKRVRVKDAKEIPADSIQSPHDPDATFCKKGKRQTQGYTVNVTETCNAEGLNLITDIQVAKATRHDTTFVVPAIQKTQAIAGKVQEASLDGAYQSADNTQWASDLKTTLHYSRMQGQACRHVYDRRPDGIQVTNIQTGEIQLARQLPSGRYRVDFTSRKPHYFQDENVDASQLRRQIEAMPDQVRQRRNNIEATIFHLVWPLRKGKTRYRGSFATRLWGTCRALWINLTRIEYYTATTRHATAT
jgi:hypothetical protein